MSNKKGSNSNDLEITKKEIGSQSSAEAIVNESNLIDDTVEQTIDSFKQKIVGEIAQRLFNEYEQKTDEVLTETENKLTELKHQYEEEIQQSKQDWENFKKANQMNQPEMDTS